MPHFGIDISSNNTFDRSLNGWKNIYAWLKAQGGGEEPFLIVKTTESTWYDNPDAAADVANARQAGFKAVAAYLFDHGSDSPQAEENYFKAHSLGLPQADDFEYPQGLDAQQYAAHAQALIALCPAALVYINQSEYQAGMPHDNLWLAQYDNVAGNPRWPCLVKQYTDALVIPNSGGKFDGNVWCGTEQQFAQYFNLVSPTPTPGPQMLTNCVGMIDDPQGRGYWLVQADGGVFTHSAPGKELPFYGSLGGKALNAPIVGGAASHDGNGYWLVGADGGVFTFGDAPFKGSTGSTKLNQPVVAIVPSLDGQGYYLVAKDGGVFSFGDAPFDGAGA